MDENAEVERMEAELLASGAMYFNGEVDEDGDPMVQFNMEILKEVHPALAQWWQDEVDQALLDLADKGLVTLDMTNPEGTIVEITDLGRDVRQALTS